MPDQALKIAQCIFEKNLAGHVNFSDEVTAAFRLCDGIVLFVDAAEGVGTLICMYVRTQRKRERERYGSLLNTISFIFISLKF